MRKSLKLVSFSRSHTVPLIAADTLTIKLATVAPKSSSFYAALTDMGAAWLTSTDGRVKRAGDFRTDRRAPSRPRSHSCSHPPINCRARCLAEAGLSEIDEAFNMLHRAVFLRIGR